MAQGRSAEDCFSLTLRPEPAPFIYTVLLFDNRVDFFYSPTPECFAREVLGSGPPSHKRKGIRLSIMGNAQTIWQHEVSQAENVARGLTKAGKDDVGWKTVLVPSLTLAYLRSKRYLRFTIKNLLFTKKLAFDAAKEIHRGNDRANEMGLIVMKTGKILEKERKGLYTEKVRSKQMNEIECLMDHYLRLFNADEESYENSIKKAYSTKNKYLSFLNRLQRIEQEVFLEAVGQGRKGRRKDRLGGFGKVLAVSVKVRNKEAERIFK
jgi:hypothetical protein